jgi:glycosyltransferase involved in cell wall biosynthesis
MDVVEVSAGERLRTPEAGRFGRRDAPRVSLVVPTLNEERNLPHVLSRVPSDVHEVIVVDGRSTDGTVAVAKRFAPRVRVLNQRGSGKGDALALGFGAATGDVVVTVDGDGSTDPAEIPRFVAALAGADLVKGSRFLDGGGSDDLTPARRLGARAFPVLVNLLFGTSYTDLCYGYTAFWRECLGRISIAPGFEVEASIGISAARAGLSVVEVASYERSRVHGASNLRVFRDGVRILVTILGARVQRGPRPEPAVARA